MLLRVGNLAGINAAEFCIHFRSHRGPADGSHATPMQGRTPNIKGFKKKLVGRELHGGRGSCCFDVVVAVVIAVECTQTLRELLSKLFGGDPIQLRVDHEVDPVLQLLFLLFAR